MKEQILELLNGLKDDVDFTSSNALIDDGLLTSLDIIMLVGGLSETFDITIPAGCIIPENFNSAEAIGRLVERLMEE